MASVKRKIMFFRVRLGKTINNEMTYIDDVTERENTILSGVNIINGLQFDLNAFNTRYLRKSNGNDLSMYIDSFNNNILEGRIVLCRRSLLPSIESQGTLSDLEIDEDAGIAEITHFKYYVSQNILGVEYNFHGPKSTQIAEYFQCKLHGLIDMFEIQIITDKSWESLLESDNNRITMFNFKATRNAQDIIRRLNSSLGEAFDAISRINNAEEIEVMIRRRSRSDSYFDNGSFNFSALFENNFTHKEEFDKLKVIVDTDEGNKEINLLEDKLCISKQVELMTGRSRTVLPTSVYSKIQEAFEECSDQLVLRM